MEEIKLNGSLKLDLKGHAIVDKRETTDEDGTLRTEVVYDSGLELLFLEKDGAFRLFSNKELTLIPR